MIAIDSTFHTNKYEVSKLSYFSFQSGIHHVLGFLKSLCCELQYPLYTLLIFDEKYSDVPISSVIMQCN